MVEKNDWRITNQSNYLKNKTLYFHNFKPTFHWDHEHCSFCCEKIGFGGIDKAYSTLDEEYWVCEACFNDFKSMFGFMPFRETIFDNITIYEIMKKELSSLEGKSLYSVRSAMAFLNNIQSSVLAPVKLKITPVRVKISIIRTEPNKLDYFRDKAAAAEISSADQLYNILSNFAHVFGLREEISNGVYSDLYAQLETQ